MKILDGGMGRELARRGAPFQQPEWSALALIQQPSAVEEVHGAFIQSGADIIATNSYAVVPFHIGEQRFALNGRDLADLSGRLAKRAVKNSQKNVKVAGSLPPLFGSYRPDLIQAERVKELAQPIIDGLAPHVDFWLFETQSAISEPVSVLPLLPQDQRVFWVSFTLEDENPQAEPCLRSGESVKSAVEKMIELGASAILFNCCQPEVIEAALIVTRDTLAENQATHIEFGAYANAFPPQPKEATANDGLDEIRTDLAPLDYLVWAKKWQAIGATIIGGCCGIGPEHIAVLAEQLK